MALLPFSSNHVYDTSLLSLGKESLNDNKETNSSAGDELPEEELSDKTEEIQESAEETLENNEEKENESTELVDQNSIEEDSEKKD